MPLNGSSGGKRHGAPSNPTGEFGRRRSLSWRSFPATWQVGQWLSWGVEQAMSRAGLSNAGLLSRPLICPGSNWPQPSGSRRSFNQRLPSSKAMLKPRRYPTAVQTLWSASMARPFGAIRIDGFLKRQDSWCQAAG